MCNYFSNSLDAVDNTSSFLEKPALKPKFRIISRNLLLLITTKESTCLRKRSTWLTLCSRANFSFKLKRNRNNTYFVKMSRSFCQLAIIGAAPVPVPPPILR